jgi:hypothetical protein
MAGRAVCTQQPQQQVVRILTSKMHDALGKCRSPCVNNAGCNQRHGATVQKAAESGLGGHQVLWLRVPFMSRASCWIQP